MSYMRSTSPLYFIDPIRRAGKRRQGKVRYPDQAYRLLKEDDLYFFDIALLDPDLLISLEQMQKNPVLEISTLCKQGFSQLPVLEEGMTGYRFNDVYNAGVRRKINDCRKQIYDLAPYYVQHRVEINFGLTADGRSYSTYRPEALRKAAVQIEGGKYNTEDIEKEKNLPEPLKKQLPIYRELKARSEQTGSRPFYKDQLARLEEEDDLTNFIVIGLAGLFRYHLGGFLQGKGVPLIGYRARTEKNFFPVINAPEESSTTPFCSSLHHPEALVNHMQALWWREKKSILLDQDKISDLAGFLNAAQSMRFYKECEEQPAPKELGFTV
jgi:hypothetical protein